jgi:hypothetical protein
VKLRVTEATSRAFCIHPAVISLLSDSLFTYRSSFGFYYLFHRSPQLIVPLYAPGVCFPCFDYIELVRVTKAGASKEIFAMDRIDLSGTDAFEREDSKGKC